MTKLQEMGRKAKAASRVLANAGAGKDAALRSIADGLVANAEKIIGANKIDLEQARAGGMSESMLDRLTLNEARIRDMAEGARQVAAQTDPIGRILSGEVRPNGMKIEKVAVPLGVIGMIYEARPNVTADAAVLCLKAGNAVILRGGKEAIHSNTAIAQVMRDAVESAGLPRDSIQLVEDTSRQSSVELMGLTEYLDVLIPRGGAGLIRSVKENSHVPVIETGVGNCPCMWTTTPIWKWRPGLSSTPRRPAPPCAMRRKRCWFTVQWRKNSCLSQRKCSMRKKCSCAPMSAPCKSWAHAIRSSPPRRTTGPPSFRIIFWPFVWWIPSTRRSSISQNIPPATVRRL